MPQQRILGSILFIATVAALTLSSGPSGAATGECLSAPSGPAPQGHHWRYHLDRASQRKCWYLGETGAKPGRAAAKSAVHSETEAETTARPFESAPAASMQPQPWPAAPSSQATGLPSAGQQLVGVAATARAPVAEAFTAGRGQERQTQVETAEAIDGGVAQPSAIGVGASQGAAVSLPDAAAGAAEATSLQPATAPVTAAAAAAAQVQPVDPGHGSFAMIGGALALATAMGLAISRWLVRRRDALHHHDPAAFVGDAPPFGMAGPEVFQPRRRASADAIAAQEDDTGTREQPEDEQQRRILAGNLESTLRSLIHALRQTAA